MVNHMHGGSIEVGYEVCLRARGLDEKGFLIDNLFISSFMEEAARKGTQLSCELLLEELADALQQAMREAEPSLEIIAFTMSLSPDFGPDNSATMKICYEADHD